MYSKARIAGRPIHPWLVALPIGLYVATFAALLACVIAGDEFYARAARLAATAGVVTSLASMIPGIIDHATLERDTRARRTSGHHARFALLATALFAGAAVLLWRGVSAVWPLVLATAGVAALVVVAASGFALVQTHRIGVAPTHLRVLPGMHHGGAHADPAKLHVVRP
jgi:uncharacterized membrane protein